MKEEYTTVYVPRGLFEKMASLYTQGFVDLDGKLFLNSRGEPFPDGPEGVTYAPARLVLNPGDILVLYAPGVLPESVRQTIADRMRERLHKAGKDNQVWVLESGVQLQVLGSDTLPDAVVEGKE